MKEERKQLDQISEYLEKVGSSENKLEDSALFFEYLDYDFSLISMGEIMTLSVLNSCKCNENGSLDSKKRSRRVKIDVFFKKIP